MNRYPSCRGSCGQKWEQCPHPDECFDDGIGLFRGLVSAAVITVGMVALVYIMVKAFA